MQIVRFAILMILAAGAVAGWRWSSQRTVVRFAATRELSTAERKAGLDRPFPDYFARDVPFTAAVKTVEILGGVHIVVRDPAGAKRVIPSISLQGAKLEDALDALVQPFYPLGYDVSNGVITIAPVRDLPQITRVYDVSDLLMTDAIGKGDARFAGPALLERLKWYNNLCLWHVTGSASKASMELIGGRLVVVQTRQRHRRLAQLIEALRYARPDGSPSGHEPPPMDGSCHAQEIVKVYDVRDLIKPTSEDAVAAESRLQTVIGRSIAEQCVPIAGRFILEATPQEHEKVVQILNRLRKEMSARSAMALK